MSAIAGILHFHGAPVEPGLIEKLTGAMKTRGPDEQTHWVQGSMALGHCMLRTTPESLEERQPLTSQDGNLVMVWDGRLDNRDELRRDLLSAGADIRDNSDAELALQAYQTWTNNSPQHLLGDFVFAVWDCAHQSLFCTRDHVGARPFYYTHNENFLAFASEDEVLLCLPDVPKKPNAELVATMLMPGCYNFDGESSWLGAVSFLPPARHMTVSSSGEAQYETYWQLEAGEEASYASEEECVQAFMAVFGEAVRCRMRSIGHVSAMMSGGLDSASIAAMVRRLLPEFPGKQLHTYSAISDQPETCAESQCILSLAEDMGNNAHFVSVPSFTGMLNVHDLVETAWPKAHPVDNSILLPAMMCLAASRDGHRVMLHGAGGDLATYVPANHPAYLLRAGQWLDAWRACKSASRNNTYLRGVSPGRLLLRNIWHAYSPPRIRYWAGRLRELKPESPLSANLINRDLAKRMRLLERRSTEYVPLQEPQNAHIRAMMGPYGFVMGLSGFEHVAGRYGVEMRDPWSDRRLAEFWLRLPLKYKLWDGWTKYLVRSGFAPDLAPLVRWRQGKEHVGWNFSSRLMDESRDFVAQVLENDLQTLAPYADVEAVRRMYAKYCAVNGYVKQSRIYDIITLIIWLKRVFR